MAGSVGVMRHFLLILAVRTAARTTHSRARCARAARALSALGLLLLIPLRAAPAQTVRGELVEETLGAPIEGAFVVLVDAGGEQVVAMLTNAVGRFVLEAPSPGRYQLKAERIGYESYTSPDLDLQMGQVLDYRMTMPVRPVELALISVEGERQCNIRKAEGERVAAVWEEARKALTTAVWTEKERNFRFTVQVWERLLDPRNMEILEQQGEILSGMAAYPFRALPAVELAEIGYARRFDDDNSTEYYAPDAETLLSDIFLDDHCFRVVEGRGDMEGMIGLEFEPVKRDGDKTDVSGVLWLSARDAHLRFVDYRYEYLPGRIRGAEKLGGRLNFRMLPGGAWVVDDWYIRMPVTEITLEGNPNPVPGSLRRLREKRKLVAVKEEGGAVVGISDPVGKAVGQTGRGSLAGVAFDSTQNAALSYATVALLGTNYRTTTDEQGQYSMEYLPPGDFFVTISHPRVGMLRLGSALRPVQIREDARVRVDLTIPSARRLAPTLCPGQERDVGIVVGLVIDAHSGDPMRDATVRLSTHLRGVFAGSEVDEPDSGVEEIQLETTSDHNGGFLFCGVPTGIRLYAAASLIDQDGIGGEEVFYFTVAEDEIHEAIFEVAAPTESLSGS
jgi:hypothetical protein